MDDLPDDVICNIAIYADHATLYSKCDQASDKWKQLELASEVESDLRDTVDWGRKWFVDFSAGKTQLVLLDWSNIHWCYWCENGWTCSWGKSSFILKCYLKFSYSHAWNTVVMSGLVFLVANMLELLEKLQKQICRTFGPSVAASLEPLAPYWNVANLSLFYRYYFGTCSTRCCNRLHNFSVSIFRCYKDVYVNSFFPCTARHWNSLPIE